MKVTENISSVLGFPIYLETVATIFISINQSGGERTLFQILAETPEITLSIS